MAFFYSSPQTISNKSVPPKKKKKNIATSGLPPLPSVGAVIQIHPAPANRKPKPTAPVGPVLFSFLPRLPVNSTQAEMKNPRPADVGFLSDVGYTGFEPVTSALSRQRSKPTELISPFRKAQFRKKSGSEKTRGKEIFSQHSISKKSNPLIWVIFKNKTPPYIRFDMRTHNV